MKLRLCFPLFMLPFVVMSCLPQSGIGNGPIVKADEIIQTIRNGKPVYLENKTIDGDLDFTQLEGYVESSSMKRIPVPVSITFMKCRFRGKVTSFMTSDNQTTVCHFEKNLSFPDCDMEQEVSIRESVISGKANFTGSTFHKTTSFEGTRFISEAFFTKARFQAEARFQNGWYGYKANWMEAVFEKVVNFQNAVFQHDAQWNVAKFMGYADFTICTFRGHTFFNYAQFKDQALFNTSYFYARFEAMQATFGKNTELKRCMVYSKLRLDKSQFNGSLNFDNTLFFAGAPETTDWVKGNDFSLSMQNVRSGSMKDMMEGDLK